MTRLENLETHFLLLARIVRESVDGEAQERVDKVMRSYLDKAKQPEATPPRHFLGKVENLADVPEHSGPVRIDPWGFAWLDRNDDNQPPR